MNEKRKIATKIALILKKGGIDKENQTLPEFSNSDKHTDTLCDP